MQTRILRNIIHWTSVTWDTESFNIHIYIYIYLTHIILNYNGKILYVSIEVCIWVKCNNSLSWIESISDWFPYKNHDFHWVRSEVVIIQPNIQLHTKYKYIINMYIYIYISIIDATLYVEIYYTLFFLHHHRPGYLHGLFPSSFLSSFLSSALYGYFPYTPQSWKGLA